MQKLRDSEHFAKIIESKRSLLVLGIAALSTVLGTTCDVYREKWDENSPGRGLSKSTSLGPDQMYHRKSCAACGSRADAQGVEMYCIDEDVASVCQSMNLFVGGAVACTGDGDCCCKGSNCPAALRKFYSGQQMLLGPPILTQTIGDACPNLQASLVVSCFFVTLLLIF
ncbi:unnamed protein product [Gongylonema pulchrum]|uniref:Uncharacterized protein n=1 Tax=Gongylonema pulchrum TaxID=637853 RepID=A0A3P7NIR5_9BILA|nr:unnamed protein product [Gongylonema pulchrum]